MRKISPPLGFDPRNVQPVDSRYTDWAIRPITKNVPYNIYGILKPSRNLDRKKGNSLIFKKMLDKPFELFAIVYFEHENLQLFLLPHLQNNFATKFKI